jgi:hypothetical protein
MQLLLKEQLLRGVVAQMVEGLPNKCEALSPTLQHGKKKKSKRTVNDLFFLSI